MVKTKEKKKYFMIIKGKLEKERIKSMNTYAPKNRP